MDHPPAASCADRLLQKREPVTGVHRRAGVEDRRRWRRRRTGSPTRHPCRQRLLHPRGLGGLQDRVGPLGEVIDITDRPARSRSRRSPCTRRTRRSSGASAPMSSDLVRNVPVEHGSHSSGQPVGYDPHVDAVQARGWRRGPPPLPPCSGGSGVARRGGDRRESSAGPTRRDCSSLGPLSSVVIA